MDASTGEEPPPDSTDVAGWKRVVADGLLDRLPLEAIVAALQDLRLNTDLGLRNDLAKNLSDRVYRLLRGQVGRNHSNEGWDIIDLHVQVFEALAQPTSADAKGLRQAFVPRVLFRLKDSIAKEARERRIPDETMVKPQQEEAPADPPGGDGQEVEFDDGASASISSVSFTFAPPLLICLSHEGLIHPSRTGSSVEARTQGPFEIGRGGHIPNSNLGNGNLPPRLDRADLRAASCERRTARMGSSIGEAPLRGRVQWRRASTM